MLRKALGKPAIAQALKGACLSWFLFDIYIYGISLYSPEILDMIFGTSDSLKVVLLSVVTHKSGL